MHFYLVTGGAGFIGSHIVHELVEHGEKVKVVDNFSTGYRRNISDILDKVELIEADIRDLESMRRAVEGVDFVLHHAALGSVPRSVSEPVASNEVNVTGTLNLLVAARDVGVKRFIYAASSSAYGDTPVLPKREDMNPHPLSPYAVSKLMGEHYCKVFYLVYGLETVSLRYFNVFGPRQDPSSQYSAAIPKFITAMLKDEPVTIYGDGEQSRDFTYVKNVVNANLLACKSSDAAGEVINIACGGMFSLNQLISVMEEELSIKARRVYTRPRAGDVMHSRADITKAKALLGYEPIVTFDKGLKKTVEWFANGNAQANALLPVSEVKARAEIV
jgi:nucleoside-diphosphate-sugar epimerase